VPIRKEIISSLWAWRESGCQFRAYDDQPFGVGVTQRSDYPFHAAASGIGPGNCIAKDIRRAEMLIARRAYPDPALLAQPYIRLKSLLAA
jgi:hypothetical protein